MLLKGRRAIVTGGASGIAAATVRAYAREGARVASIDIDDASGQAVAEEAEPEVAYFHCDVSKRAEVLETFAHCVEWSSQFHSGDG
ncbi:MAG: SDR family NAD(P)-dependent oxidoreductase [Myxococcales bacterium]|nr:SDR family NAD(P)-dependent oxidoreductase [Myxococcales bacterium]TDJ03014.1 MAG: SDR family NAD(P)-dependent oxidoreductase [Deltaproteobacteria bacterium]